MIDVTAAGYTLQAIGDVLPSIALPAFGRQMTLDQLAHIAERGQGHDMGNF